MNDREQAIIGMRGLKELLPPLLLKFNYENLGKEDAIEVVEHLNLAISALEKQVANPFKCSEPVKVKALDTETEQVLTFDCLPCPDCGKWIVINQSKRYCEYCGQKLDWEGDE